MNVIAFVVTDDKDKKRISKLKNQGKCPVHFKEFAWLNLCEGGCADGCVQPGDGKRCWEIVEGERKIPWFCLFGNKFGKMGW